MKQTILRHEAQITQDITGKKIVVTRAFDAPPEKIWRAFTEREILDRWWAPKPMTIETKSLDFRPGGIWHFCMCGAKGERYWWRVDYKTIDDQRSITTAGGPADENGNPTGGLPPMQRLTEFTPTPTGTVVSITILFQTEADLKKMAESGMMAGTSAAFNHLEELLEADAI